MVVIPPEWLAEKLSNSEIARRLNCSTTAIIYAKRRMQGQCERCNRKALPECRFCATHLKQVRKYHRSRTGHKPWKPGGRGRPPLSARKEK